jgi:hypothetical protein
MSRPLNVKENKQQFFNDNSLLWVALIIRQSQDKI